MGLRELFRRGRPTWRELAAECVNAQLRADRLAAEWRAARLGQPTTIIETTATVVDDWSAEPPTPLDAYHMREG